MTAKFLSLFMLVGSCIVADSCSLPSNTLEQTPVIKRKYKESETSLAYTFSRVNLGGLNNPPAFVQYHSDTPQPPQVLNYTFRYKNISNKPANEFNYTYLQTLDSDDKKVFLNVNYVHSDGVTQSPIPYGYGSNTFSSFVHPFFRGKTLAMTEEIQSIAGVNLPYFSCVKNKFDLGSAQSGVQKRFFRSKNADFSLYGGLDLAYFTNFYKISVLGLDTIDSAFTWSKSSKNVTSVNDPSTIPNTGNFASFNPQGEEEPYTRSFKNRFYGIGPLFGAKLQTPFAYDYLRLNVKAEVSALMGYGTSYFHYDQPFYELVGIDTLGMTELDVYDSSQHHVIRVVPTLRGEVSLDVIWKNFGLSGGFQEQVYFMLMDINPLVDHQEFMTEYNYSISSDFNHGNANSSRSRLGTVIHGGPFIRATYFF